MTVIFMGKVNRKSFVIKSEIVSKRCDQYRSRTPKKLKKKNSRKNSRKKSKMSNFNINKFQDRLKNILKSNTPSKKAIISNESENPNKKTINNANTSLDFIPLHTSPNKKRFKPSVQKTPFGQIQGWGMSQVNFQFDNIPTTSTPYKKNQEETDQNRNNCLLPSPIVCRKNNMKSVSDVSDITLPPVLDVINVDDESYGTLVTIDEVLGSSSDEDTVIALDSTVDKTVIQKVAKNDDVITLGDSIDLTTNTPVNCKRKRKKNDAISPRIFTTYDLTESCEILENIGKINPRNEKQSLPVDILAQNMLGQCYQPSNSLSGYFGTNIYRPKVDNQTPQSRTGLRMIVIDGSNVAMQHTHGKFFSVEGLNICIDYFLKRGHTVKAFVPRFRNKNKKSSNPKLLQRLEEQGHVVYTPSRQVGGKFITSYDDRYIVQCAATFDGVVVSCDDYRDILKENDNLRDTIEKRLLPFTWVDNMIMFPHDPLGQNGPELDAFLRHPSS